MRNIFLFFYLPCVILEAKTFQRKTDIMEIDGVASPARKNHLDRQRIPSDRTWETRVNDYKNVMDPSKCTSRGWTFEDGRFVSLDWEPSWPCVAGRRVGCVFRREFRGEYGYNMCMEDTGGRDPYYYWLTAGMGKEFRCDYPDDSPFGGNEGCKYFAWYIKENGAYAASGVGELSWAREIYDEIRRRITAEGGQP